MNTETQRHRVFILCAAIHLCVSVSLCSNLYPLDLWSLARARSCFFDYHLNGLIIYGSRASGRATGSESPCGWQRVAVRLGQAR